MNGKKRKPCIKWTDEECYKVRKYASRNRIAAVVRHDLEKITLKNNLYIQTKK